MSQLHVNENSEIYYQGGYWNDFATVRRHLNARVSGDPLRAWGEHFAAASGRTFERALILNCGNGWVERELMRTGLFVEGVGIDYSEQLLREATSSAKSDRLPLRYEQCDINVGPLPSGPFDLVINHAAAHHIASIDRVFRDLCRLLSDDGWFVSFDYVGPHRNQYKPDAWEEAWRVNQDLPASLRQDLRYPHLPTMLVTDPTEAIHSELILQTFHRYFTVEEFTPLGGAVAYPLLTHNRGLLDEADVSKQTRWIEWVLEADDRFLEAHPASSLFAYFAGRPNKASLQQSEQLQTWQAEESERELYAADHGGEYYPRSALATALVDLEVARCEGEVAMARVRALESEIATVNSSDLYAGIRRFFDARATRRIRRNRLVGGIERRVRAARTRANG